MYPIHSFWSQTQVSAHDPSQLPKIGRNPSCPSKIVYYLKWLILISSRWPPSRCFLDLYNLYFLAKTIISISAGSTNSPVLMNHEAANCRSPRRRSLSTPRNMSGTMIKMSSVYPNIKHPQLVSSTTSSVIHSSNEITPTVGFRSQLFHDLLYCPCYPRRPNDSVCGL